MGWWYDWGDGTISSSYFATYHRYESPGTYLIRVHGFDDQGNSKTVSLTHKVSAHPRTPLRRVHLSDYFVGMGDDDTSRVTIFAEDTSGNAVSLGGHTTELYNPQPQRVTAWTEGAELVVSANETFEGDACIAYLYVYVDGLEVDRPLAVIINKHPGMYCSAVGQYTVTYLPCEFFDLSRMAEQDYTKLLDLGYLLENGSIRGLRWEPGRMLWGVTYCPSVHGASGNPLVMGDSAMPRNGIPQLGIVFHEMGHGFHGHPAVFNRFGVPGAFYQETMAEWMKQFVYETILSEFTDQISIKAVEAVEAMRKESLEYHRFEYDRYIDAGCVFDYYQTGGGSHPLVHLIYGYSQLHGWHRIRRFLDHFQYDHIPDYSLLFAVHGGIEPIENRVTMMAAALSSTFHLDVRPDFLRLNFPLNDPLYDELTELLSRVDFNGDERQRLLPE